MNRLIHLPIALFLLLASAGTAGAAAMVEAVMSSRFLVRGESGTLELLLPGEVEPDDALELPGPWLAGLIVDPRSRREGVASALINFVTAKAKDMGFERLRLVTEHEVSFYERRGWVREREVTLNSVPNTVMFTTLSP